MFKKFKNIIGKTVYKIDGLEKDSFDVTFYCTDGSVFKMCPEDISFLYGNDCETTITDVCGNPNDLLDSPIIIAKESSNRNIKSKWGDEMVWTFYTFATKKGYVDVRWFGEHNGYYSADVKFFEVKK